MNIDLFEERNGLFILLSLGEVLVAGISANLETSTGHRSSFDIYLAAALTIAIAFLIKMLYFDVGQSAHFPGCAHALKRSKIAGRIWILIHIPLNMAIVLMGSALENFVSEGFMDQQNQWLFCGSVTAVLMFLAVIHLLHRGGGRGLRRIRKKIRIIVRTLGAAVIAFFPLFFRTVGTMVMVVAVVLSLGCLLAFDLFGQSIGKKAKLAELTTVNEHTTNNAEMGHQKSLTEPLLKEEDRKSIN